MKARACTAVLVWIFAILAGCAATKSWVSIPTAQSVRTASFAATFTPLTEDKPYFNLFRLEIVNLSAGELIVDWNASRYLYEGRPAGRFVYRGIDRENVKEPPPDVIAAAGRLRRDIAPLRLIAWGGYKAGYTDRAGFSAGPVPEGRNGILLVVRQNGSEMRETLSVEIAAAE